MGQASSKLSQAMVFFRSSPDYRVLEAFQEPHFGTVKLVEDNDTGRQMLLKEIIFNDKDAFDLEYGFFTQRALISHPNILHILGFDSHTAQNLCSKLYKILIFVETTGTNLERELQEHMKINRPFDENSLILLTENVISALAYLQNLGLVHGDVRPFNIFDFKSSYKLFDPSLAPERELNGLGRAILMREKSYLSPDLVRQVPQNMITCTSNQFKADVFSLGVTLLSLATLTKGEDLYNYEEGTFDEELLYNRLAQVKEHYSMFLYELVESMLIIDETKRPDFQELQDHLAPFQEEMTKKRNILFSESIRERTPPRIENLPEVIEFEPKEQHQSSGKKIFSQDVDYRTNENRSFNFQTNFEEQQRYESPFDKKSGSNIQQKGSMERKRIFDEKENIKPFENIYQGEILGRQSERKSEGLQAENYEQAQSESQFNFDYGRPTGTERENVFEFQNPFEEENREVDKRSGYQENWKESQWRSSNQEESDQFQNQGIRNTEFSRTNEQRTDMQKSGSTEMKKPGSILIDPENVDPNRMHELQWNPQGKYFYANLSHPQTQNFKGTEEKERGERRDREERSLQGSQTEPITVGGLIIKPEDQKISKLFSEPSEENVIKRVSSQGSDKEIEQLEQARWGKMDENKMGKAPSQEQIKAEGVIIQPENISQTKLTKIYSNPKEEEEAMLHQQSEREKRSTEFSRTNEQSTEMRSSHATEVRKPGSILIDPENVDPNRMHELHWDPTGKYFYANLNKPSQELEPQNLSHEQQKEWSTRQGYISVEPERQVDSHEIDFDRVATSPSKREQEEQQKRGRPEVEQGLSSREEPLKMTWSQLSSQKQQEANRGSGVEDSPNAGRLLPKLQENQEKLQSRDQESASGNYGGMEESVQRHQNITLDAKALFSERSEEEWVDFSSDLSPRKESREPRKTGSILIEPEDVLPSKQDQLRMDPGKNYHYANLKPQNWRETDLMNLANQEYEMRNQTTKTTYPEQNIPRGGQEEQEKRASGQVSQGFTERVVEEPQNEFYDLLSLDKENAEPRESENKTERQHPLVGLREYYLEYTRPNEKEPIKGEEENLQRSGQEKPRESSRVIERNRRTERSPDLKSKQPAETSMTPEKDLDEMDQILKRAFERTRRTFDAARDQSHHDISVENINPNLKQSNNLVGDT